MYIIIICIIIILLCTYKKIESFLTNNSYVISIFLTENHCTETENLLTTLQSHNLLHKVVITCLDEKCFNFMKKWDVKLSLFKQDVEKEATYHTLEFRKIVKNKLKILINLLKEYQKPVLHIDTDIVVLREDLDSDINKLCKTDFDMIFQSDCINITTKNNRCTGFILLNNTPNTFFCLKQAIKIMDKNINHPDHWGDQKSINYVIDKNPTKYKINTFNHKDYPNGYRYFNNLDTIYKTYKPIIVHNNYIKGLQNKINRFKKHDLWFLEKKVAICFFGLTRSLKHNLPFLQKNIFDVLTKNKYAYDIYIHTYNKEGIHNNPRANEENVILDNEEYKLLNATQYQIDDEESMNDKIPMEIFKDNGDPWKNDFSSFSNFIKQLISLYEVTTLWEPIKHEYDSVIYIRPDTVISRPLEINLIKKYEENTIYLPKFHPSGGYNDRFAFGPPDVMLIYGKRFESGLNYSLSYLFHAETFLKHILENNKIDIKYTNMIVCRRRGNKELNKSDIDLLLVHEKINILN